MSASPALIRLGEIIGSYRDKPIYDIITEGGKRFAFNGIAVEEPDGTIDLNRLQDGDWVITPGLVYRCIGDSVLHAEVDMDVAARCTD